MAKDRPKIVEHADAQRVNVLGGYITKALDKNNATAAEGIVTMTMLIDESIRGLKVTDEQKAQLRIELSDFIADERE